MENIDARDVTPKKTPWRKAGAEDEQSVEFKLFEFLTSIPSHLCRYDTDTDVTIDISRSRSIHAPQIETIWEGELKMTSNWGKKKLSHNKVLY